jgi:WD40 repeat protein
VAIAYYNDDGVINLFDARTGRKVSSFSGHTGVVSSLAFNKDGTKLLSAGRDGIARVWSVASNQESLRLDSTLSIPLRGAMFSPDYKTILTWGGTTTWVWDATAGKVLTTLSGHSGALTNASFSPNGRFALTASKDGSTLVWDIITGKNVASFQSFTGDLGSGTEKALNDPVVGASFGPDNETIFVSQLNAPTRRYKCVACSSIEDILKLARESRNIDSVTVNKLDVYRKDPDAVCASCADLATLMSRARSRATRTLSEAGGERFITN